MEIQEYKYGERLFKLHDRVKAYYKGNWYTGTIVSFKPWRMHDDAIHWKILSQFEFLRKDKVFVEERDGKVFYDDYMFVNMFIKTDEQIVASEGLFDGFGLQSDATATYTIFENEPEFTPKSFIVLSKHDEPTDLPF